MKKLLCIVTVLTLLVFIGCEYPEISQQKNEKNQKESSKKITRGVMTNGSTFTSQEWSDFAGKTETTVKTLDDLKIVFYELFDNFTLNPVNDNILTLLDSYLTGDTNDFAVTLRERLIEFGFLRINVRLAYCYPINNDNTFQEKRMVCIVEANKGMFYVCEPEGLTTFIYYKARWISILDESEQYWVRMYN